MAALVKGIYPCGFVFFKKHWANNCTNYNQALYSFGFVGFITLLRITIGF
jgi:hypothetical protein